MSRLSNRDVDALVQSEYEEALADDKQWAVDTLQVHQWAALQGKTVEVGFKDGGTAIGVWDWHGMTGDDFYLFYLLDPKVERITGTDPRNCWFISIVGQEGAQGESGRSLQVLQGDPS